MIDLQFIATIRNAPAALASLRRYLLGSNIQPITAAGKRKYKDDQATSPATSLGSAEYPFTTLHAEQLAIGNTYLNIANLQSGVSAATARAQSPIIADGATQITWPFATASAVIIANTDPRPTPNGISVVALNLWQGKIAPKNGGGGYLFSEATAPLVTAHVCQLTGFVSGQTYTIGEAGSLYLIYPDFGLIAE